MSPEMKINIVLYKTDRHERAKNTAQHDSRVEWLEQQIKDKEDLIASMNGRLRSAESRESSTESALEDARATAARAEDRVSASAGEIRKGNQIIERLQAELRSAKAKAPPLWLRPPWDGTVLDWGPRHFLAIRE